MMYGYSKYYGTIASHVFFKKCGLNHKLVVVKNEESVIAKIDKVLLRGGMVALDTCEMPSKTKNYSFKNAHTYLITKICCANKFSKENLVDKIKLCRCISRNKRNLDYEEGNLFFDDFSEIDYVTEKVILGDLGLVENSIMYKNLYFHAINGIKAPLHEFKTPVFKKIPSIGKLRYLNLTRKSLKSKRVIIDDATCLGRNQNQLAKLFLKNLINPNENLKVKNLKGDFYEYVPKQLGSCAKIISHHFSGSNFYLDKNETEPSELTLIFHFNIDFTFVKYLFAIVHTSPDVRRLAKHIRKNSKYRNHYILIHDDCCYAFPN